jgi:cytochrome c553
MTVKQRDWLFIGLIVVILAVFFSISGKVKTTRIPIPEDHSRFFEIVAKDGKKAAEKFCGECHNDQGVQFPKDHPPKFRCLFCHKLEER